MKVALLKATGWDQGLYSAFKFENAKYPLLREISTK